jgi:hypothetical protein
MTRPVRVRLRSRPMAEQTLTLEQQLEEIGTQLAWVRDYL